jgi:hypothetical protein
MRHCEFPTARTSYVSSAIGKAVDYCAAKAALIVRSTLSDTTGA